MTNEPNVDLIWITDEEARTNLSWFVSQYVDGDRYWAARAIQNAGVWVPVRLEEPKVLLLAQNEYERRLLAGEVVPLPAAMLDWPDRYDDGLALYRVHYYLRFRAEEHGGRYQLYGYDLMATLEELDGAAPNKGEEVLTSQDLKKILEARPHGKEQELVQAVLNQDWERARELLDTVDPEALVPDVVAGHDVPFYWHLTRVVAVNQKASGPQAAAILDALYERARDRTFHDQKGRTVALWLVTALCRKEETAVWLPLLLKVLTRYDVPSHVDGGPSVLGELITNIHCVLNKPAVLATLAALAQRVPNALEDPVPWDEVPDNLSPEILRRLSRYRAVPPVVLRRLVLPLVSETFYV